MNQKQIKLSKEMLTELSQMQGKTIQKVFCEDEWTPQDLCLHFTDGTAIYIEPLVEYDDSEYTTLEVYALPDLGKLANLELATDEEVEKFRKERNKEFMQKTELAKELRDEEEYERLKVKFATKGD